MKRNPAEMFKVVTVIKWARHECIHKGFIIVSFDWGGAPIHFLFRCRLTNVIIKPLSCYDSFSFKFDYLHGDEYISYVLTMIFPFCLGTRFYKSSHSTRTKLYACSVYIGLHRLVWKPLYSINRIYLNMLSYHFRSFYCMFCKWHGKSAACHVWAQPLNSAQCIGSCTKY